METRSLPANIKNEYWALGIYQIFGGVVGLFVTGWTLFLLPDSKAVVATVFLGLMSYGFTVLSGIYCIRLQSAGLKYTIVNQSLQILWFAIFGVSFKYGSGLFLVVGGDFTESFDFILNVGLSNLKIYYSSRSQEIAFSVNVVAVWVISRAMRLKRILSYNVE